jgi:hypothetical protein
MPNQYTKKDNDNDDIITLPPSPNVVVDPKNNYKPVEKTTPKKTEPQGPQTLIPLSQTRDEYVKASLTMPYIQAEDQREVFERQTKGKWTRKVTKVVWLNTQDDEQYLDWSEERTGKTQMGRKLSLTVDNVAKYVIPVPVESVEYDPDNDENKLVTADREQEQTVAYAVPFSKEALQELIDDAMPHRCEYIISQQGARNYSCTKKEIQKYAGDFETLYGLKSDPDFKIEAVKKD